LGNGGSSVIQVHLNKLQVQVAGRTPINDIFVTRDFRLLPGHTKSFYTPVILGIPEGEIAGEIKYEIIYGPPTGQPRYLRTHHVAITESQPITCVMVESQNFDKVVLNYTDIHEEEDEDIP
jgi:hypothetical protein